MNDSLLKKLKLSIGTAIVGGVGWFIVPILLQGAINLLLLGITGVLLIALWLLLPGITEFFAQVGYRLFEVAIRMDPVAKGQRALASHAKQLEEIGKSAGEVRGEIESVKGIIKAESKNLSGDAIQGYEEQVVSLEGIYDQMLTAYREETAFHQQFENDVRRLVADNRVSGAMNRAWKAVSKAQGGKRDPGTEIAFDESMRRMAQSKARLENALALRRMGVAALANHPVAEQQVLPASVVQSLPGTASRVNSTVNR